MLRPFYKSIFIVSILLLLTACGGFDFSGKGDPDITAPVITVYGDNPKNVPLGAACSDEGATAVDDRDGIVTVVVSGTVDVTTVGIYTITYTATDRAGNSSTQTRTVHVVSSSPDTTPPVITLLGSTPLTIEVNSGYTDAGATADDNIDGNITASILTANHVDHTTIGDYNVTYTVSDAAGNAATPVVRIVHIVDSTPPVISLLGSTPLTIEVGSTYTDAGATADDNIDGNITANIVTTSTVNAAVIGDYNVTYTVSDATGNAATPVVRIVHVVDSTPPVISLLGSTPLTILRRHPYSDAGATATDNIDGNITSNINTTNDVNISTLGTYTVAYTVVDSHGNYAELNRTVTVIESNLSFRLRIDTDHNSSYSSADKQFMVPTVSGKVYNYNIDCDDDGIWDATGVSGDYNCSYAASGNYILSIEGTFPHIAFNRTGDANKTLSIEQWGDIEWGSMRSAFEGCSRLQINATDTPDLSSVTDMHNMFHQAYTMNSDISDWNVSTVVNMSGLFAAASAFDQDIDCWDVSSATDMHWMFSNAQNFNQDLNSWDVSHVTDMAYMFKEAFAFNGDITDWNTSQVTDMQEMFHEAFAFNQDIGDWNVSNVTNMHGMFNNAWVAGVFNQDIGDWDTSSVTDMSKMFRHTANFDQDIGEWNTSSVTNMSQMFYNSQKFNQELKEWDTHSVTNMYAMFHGAKEFNSSIADWDTSAVTAMTYMFKYATKFNRDISDWNVGSVIYMQAMFKHAEDFNQDISDWNVSSVQYMDYMFYGAEDFNQSIGDWEEKTSNVRTMKSMFYEATSFNQNIGDWNVSNVQDMSYMFYKAEDFNQDITDWDVSQVTDMSYMFSHAKAFNQQIGDWGSKTSNVLTMRDMFNNATSFDQDIGDWDITSVTNMIQMFNDVALSETNYTLLLKGWADGAAPQDDVEFDGGDSSCGTNTTCDNKRQHLIDNYNWDIYDQQGSPH